MISPSAAASTEVPAGAGMSIASWVRPSERASLKVSISCSRRTPATGTIKFSVPTKPSGEAAGVACGVIMTEGSSDGSGEEVGDEVTDGLGKGVTTTATDGLANACGGTTRRAISPPRRLCKTQTTATAMHTNSDTTTNHSRTCFVLSCCPICFILLSRYQPDPEFLRISEPLGLVGCVTTS